MSLSGKEIKKLREERKKLQADLKHLEEVEKLTYNDDRVLKKIDQIVKIDNIFNKNGIPLGPFSLEECYYVYIITGLIGAVIGYFFPWILGVKSGVAGAIIGAIIGALLPVGIMGIYLVLAACFILIIPIIFVVLIFLFFLLFSL